jgi:hypothetical protein
LQLTPGTHRIGTDDDADIRLADWRGADTLLHVDASGVVRAQRIAARDDATVAAAESAQPAAETPRLPVPQEEVILLVDFVPMQFDDTILCVGADDAACPQTSICYRRCSPARRKRASRPNARSAIAIWARWSPVSRSARRSSACRC